MLVLAVLVWVSAVAGQAAAQAAPGPVAVGGACENERYEALLNAGFTVMSEEQFRYFLSLDQACRMHKRDVAAAVTGSPDNANPCIHEPYKTIADKAPEEMSEREYVYFREVGRECAAYERVHGTPKPVTTGPELPSPGRRVLTSLVVLGSMVATLVASLN